MTPIELDTPLPDDLEAAHRLIHALIETLRQQTHLNEKLPYQLEQLLRRLYGRKSETLDPNQLLLFACEILEATAAESETTPTPEPAVPAAVGPPAKGHGRKPLPANLPRRRVIHDVPLEQRLCPDWGLERRCFGEEVREQLE